MGMYTWLTESELQRFKKISDKELNELLSDVLEVIPSIRVHERFEIKKRWFRKPIEITRYSVYHQIRPGDIEVHVLNLNFSNKSYLANYLFGLLNGYGECMRQNQIEI